MTRNDAYISALAYGTGTYVQPQFNTVTVPAFSYEHSNVVAAIIAEAELGNADAVSIRLPLPEAVAENEAFALCARYTENSNTYRYVLYKPDWFDGILWPEYTGQKLGADAVLEIWTLDSLSPCEGDEFTLTVGPLNFQAAGQIATCGQIQGTDTTLTLTEI